MAWHPDAAVGSERMSLTGQMTGSGPLLPMKAVERLLLVCFLLFSTGESDVCGPLLSTGLTIQSEGLRPMEMVGLGRPQSCSGALGSLQQIAMRRVRELVESLRGGGSGGAAFSGGGLQQEEGEACEQGWMASLLAHRAASLMVLLATAGLACLAFWDFRIAVELVLWPWRACMAIIHCMYQNLDERRISQRRQIAEVALRAAMKSGDVEALSQALEEAETARVDVPVKRRAAAQLRELRRKLARVQKKLRSGREPRRASSSPRRSSRSRSASPPSQGTSPEEHSASGSASELHGGAQQAGWQGGQGLVRKETIIPLQNGARDGGQSRSGASGDKGSSLGPSRQPSRSLSLQSSLSEPTTGQSGSGQDGQQPSGAGAPARARGQAPAGAEAQLRRDSTSQVEIAARAVEAREAEKERLRQEKENSRRERAQAKLMQQQQQQQAPTVSETPQDNASQAPASGIAKGILKGSSFFGNGRPSTLANGTGSETRNHYRAPRKAVPISLVSDSTTPRAKRGPSTLCVPRNQAHMNGDGGTKAGTPKTTGGPAAKDGGLSWSPSSAPATPSGKGDGVPGLPFTQGAKAAGTLNGFGDAAAGFVQPPPPPPKTWAQAARGKVQGERPVSADSRPSTAPEHVMAAGGGARSGSLNGLFQSPAASPAPQAQAPSFVASSLYASEGFRFPGGVSEPGAGSLSPFPGMTANRMVAPISRPPPLSQMGGWSGEEVLPSLGLPAFPGAAFSGAGTMMSMPQAAPSAYPGLQGLWGPVTQPPPTGSSPPGWNPWRLTPPTANCDLGVPSVASPRDPLASMTNGAKGDLSEESSVPSGSRFSTMSASSSLETCT